MKETGPHYTPGQLLRWAARFPSWVAGRIRARRLMSRPDGAASARPMRVTFEPTRRCNLNCAMCYIDESKRRQKVDELDLAEFETLLDDVRVRGINLVGGEPLMRRDLFDLLDVLRRRRIKVDSLTTNGTMIGREKADRLADLVAAGALASVTMSLDGRETLHNEIRGSDKAFSLLAAGVEHLKAALAAKGLDHRRFIKIITTVSESNFSTFAEVVDILAGWDLGVLQVNHLTFATPEERDQSARALGVDPGTIDTYVLDVDASPLDGNVIRDNLVEISHRARQARIEWTGRPFCDPKTAPAYYTGSFDPETKCPCPWVHARIGAGGDLAFCFLIRSVVADVRRIGVGEGWNSDRYRELRRRFKETGCLPVCRRCCKVILLEDTPA